MVLETLTKVFSDQEKGRVIANLDAIVEGASAMDIVVVETSSGSVIQERSFDRTMPLNRRSVSELPVVLSRILTEELEALWQSLRGKGPSVG